MAILRRLVPLLVAAALLAGSAAPATARGAIKAEFPVLLLGCEDTSTADGTIRFFAVLDSPLDFVLIALWPAGSDPDEDYPSHVSATSDLTYTLLDDHLDLQAPLERIDPSTGEGTTIGTVSVAAELKRIGEPWDVDYSERFGNRWSRLSGTLQQLTASATITLPAGQTFHPAPCDGVIGSLQTFDTDPTALTGGGSWSELGCQLASRQGMVWLDVTEFGTDLTFFPADPFLDPLWGSEYGDVVELGEGEFHAQIRLTDFYGNEAGTALVDATLEAVVTPQAYREIFRRGRAKTVEQPYLVTGRVRMPTGERFSLRPCIAYHIDYHFSLSEPQAAPAGAAPSNDTPAGATRLRVGTLLSNVRTGTAVRRPEARCDEDDPDVGTWPVPIRRTVWYRMRGTGAKLSIDTAGSDFDTVVGVYTRRDGVMRRVGCVNNVQLGVSVYAQTLQAKISFPTVAGRDYFIQVGGYTADEWGRLRLEVR
jgi:hypothetical protein